MGNASKRNNGSGPRRGSNLPAVRSSMPDEDYQPVVIKTRSDEERAADGVITLFSIDDVDYTIPKRPRVNLAFKYLGNLKSMGEAEANAQLLTDLVGEEGFTALTECEDVTPEQFGRIMSGAAKMTMGSLEAAQGN